MAAAAFLKDNNYSVLVFEKEANIGGHCNTFYFTPPDGGKVNWVDLGVREFQNTFFDNQAGYGNWTLDSVAFVKRFAKSGVVPLEIAAGIPTYGMDLNHNIYLGSNPLPQPQPGPEFALAFEALYAYVSQFPWLNTADIPEEVPEELLIPFSDFIVKYNLSALNDVVFTPVLFNGGLGYYSKLTTIYALLNLSPSILALFNPTTTSLAGFNPAEGCADLYAGIEEYIGKENVIRNANTHRVDRSRNGEVKLRVSIDGAKAVSVSCNHLIIAFPETLESLHFMDLDFAEYEVFKHVLTRSYYDFAVDVTGPLENTTFSFANVNAVDEGAFPSSPAVLSFERMIPYGPLAGVAFAEPSVCPYEVESVIRAQIKEIPDSLFTADVVALNRHVFQPHFTAEAIRSGVYNSLAALQGFKNTYWLSALVGYADSTVLWQKAFTLVANKFPKK